MLNRIVVKSLNPSLYEREAPLGAEAIQSVRPNASAWIALRAKSAARKDAGMPWE